MSRVPLWLLPAGTALAVFVLVHSPVSSRLNPAAPHAEPAEIAEVVHAIDAGFTTRWKDANIEPLPTAKPTRVLRRLSLALHGTVPSLQELREFEADDKPDRLQRWTARMLADRRFADYFAERLARPLVGTEFGPFLLNRRDRFVPWLAERIHTAKPFDETVRKIVGDEGRWTGTASVNFITSSIANGKIDHNKLTARTARALLGQRIDCAQCHDSFFDDWKQSQFEGIAAFFGQAKLTPLGIADYTSWKNEPLEFEIERPAMEDKSAEKETISPIVPFGEEWLPKEGTRRERLAVWITHPNNKRFPRAIAARVWALMFGRAYDYDNYGDLPVDNLPNPEDTEKNNPITLLAEDFAAHGYDIKRMIEIIAASRAFRLASEFESEESQFEAVHQHWAGFPRTLLRPEQVIGAMLQANSARTIDRNSNFFVRAIRIARESDFVKDYGELGDDEFAPRTFTMSQSLLMQNGNLSHEMTKASLLSTSAAIADFAENKEEALRLSFLVCLSRDPTDRELELLIGLWDDANTDRKAVQDCFWILFNFPEFSWNL